MKVTIKPNYDEKCRIAAYILIGIIGVLALIIAVDIYKANHNKKARKDVRNTNYIIETINTPHR